MKMKIDMSGFKELDAALKQFKKTTAKAVMRRALIKSAQPMKAEMEKNAPKRTEELAHDIHISTRATGADAGKSAFRDVMRGGGTKGEAVTALRNVRRQLGGSVMVYVGPSTDTSRKANLQEFGTIHHAPQPFMRPAWDREAQPTVDRLGGELAKEIDKTARRVAVRAARKAGWEVGG